MAVVAVSRGSVHDVFTDTAEKLKNWRNNSYQADIGLTQREWQFPGVADGGTGDPNDLASFTNVYDRDAIDKNYEVCVTSIPPGTVGDGQSLRLQGDYVAMAERAMRTRHCSPIRGIIHHAARDRGLSSSTGVFEVWVKSYVENLITIGERDAGTP